jgi:hypothetical protein
VLIVLIVLCGFAYGIRMPTSSRVCTSGMAPDDRLYPSPTDAFEAWWPRASDDGPPRRSTRRSAPSRLTLDSFEARDLSSTRVAYVWHYNDRADWEVMMIKEEGGWLLTGASFCEQVGRA